MISDRTIRTNLRALTAFDTLRLVDMRLLLFVKGDRAALADVLTAVGETASAGFRDLIAAHRTFITGNFNDLDRVGVILIAAHRHLYALVNDRALLIYTAPHGRRLTGNDDLGHLREVFEQGSFKGEARNFAQNAVFQILYLGIKLSHLG